MDTIEILILVVGTFVVPAVVILGDNQMFSSRVLPAPVLPS